MSEKRPRLWAVVGATGTGKSRVAIDLAHAIRKANPSKRPEIINSDAMQFYRGMDIGTAKVPPGDRGGVKHHLFDELDISEEATVAWYQPAARNIISEILQRGDDAILVGGSGLYVSSVLYDFNFPVRDEELRNRLQEDLEREGIDHLLERLRVLAPETLQRIDTRNPRRVLRVLEIVLLGEKLTPELPDRPTLWHSETTIIGLHVDRSELTDRLDARVLQIWENGLVDEVKELLAGGSDFGPTAARAIGYQQARNQFEGRNTEQEAIAETQALTRRYARRQVSWFKRYPDINWVDVTGGIRNDLAGGVIEEFAG